MFQMEICDTFKTSSWTLLICSICRTKINKYVVDSSSTQPQNLQDMERAE